MTWLEFAQAVALTLLFVMGSIFKPLRERGPKLWQDLVSCPLCLGFWIGYFKVARPWWETAKLGEVLGFVLWGALVGVVSTAVHRTLELLDAKRHESDLMAKVLEKEEKEESDGS